MISARPKLGRAIFLVALYYKAIKKMFAGFWADIRIVENSKSERKGGKENMNPAMTAVVQAAASAGDSEGPVPQEKDHKSKPPRKKVANRQLLSSARTIVAIHALFWMAIWIMVPWKLLPTPFEVWDAFVGLWNQGFAVDLWTSFWLNVAALVVSSIISASIVYLSGAPYIGKHIRVYLIAISKFRFMGMVGWSLVFTLMFGGGYYLKLALMVFAMTGFMVVGMASVIADIPKVRYDHARTLRMGEWRIIWEVDMKGALSEITKIVIQNAAIGWTILTVVEGLSRSQGGVGVLLLSQDKFFRLEEIFAIQLSILFLALLQDMFLGWVHTILFPYAYLKKEKR